MCAAFLLTGLRKKTVSPGVSGLDDHIRNPGTTDLFGSSDAIVKHLLEVCSEGAGRGWSELRTVRICIYSDSVLLGKSLVRKQYSREGWKKDRI